jgi:3-hydroxybutyryl-CoA dehydrogenase
MLQKKYNIGIIGYGKMGKDLFDYLSGFPYPITLVCKTESTVEQAKSTFYKKQRRTLKHQLIDQDTHDFRQQNTVFTTDLTRLTNCNLVIETITENRNSKRELFHRIQPILSADCVITSNTSSIPPEELFHGLVNETNCLGLHFFFPVGMKDIVEINVANNTSKKAVSFIVDFLNKIGRSSILLTRENHFIINRLFLKIQAGCCQLLLDEKYSMQQIDSLVKTHLFPIGIFEFFDQVGNDVMLQSVRNYIKYEDDPDFYQAMITLLEQKVSAGKLGVKSKSGFYDYPLKKSLQTPGEIHEALQTIVNWYLDSVFNTFQNSISTKIDLEHIIREYMMIEKSPFEIAKAFSYNPK